MKRAPKYGRHYEDGEIALIYLMARSDNAKAALAELLGRTPDAIDLIWRWIEEADFPPEAHNRIVQQIEKVRDLLGDGVQSIVKL